MYFRKRKADGDFELHGDNATRLKHVKGIINLLRPLTIFNIGAGIYNVCLGVGLNSVVNVICGSVSLALTVLLCIGLSKLKEKKQQLEKDSQLFE